MSIHADNVPASIQKKIKIGRVFYYVYCLHPMSHHFASQIENIALDRVGALPTAPNIDADEQFE